MTCTYLTKQHQRGAAQRAGAQRECAYTVRVIRAAHEVALRRSLRLEEESLNVRRRRSSLAMPSLTRRPAHAGGLAALAALSYALRSHTVT